MNCFILGFHRLVWCPKWTPASNNSLMPILSTSFLLLEAHRRMPANHPAEHGIRFDVVMAPCTHSNTGVCGRFPAWDRPPNLRCARPKGDSNVAKRAPLAIVIFQFYRWFRTLPLHLLINALLRVLPEAPN